jgi:transcriptional regulator with XRE-family HTH domain
MKQTDWNILTEKDIIKTLGNNIKKLRLQKKLTQQDVAVKTGLNRSNISEIERGKNTTLLSFILILRALGSLALLDVFVVEDIISPVQIHKMQQKLPKRVKHKTK